MPNGTVTTENAINSALNPQIATQTRIVGQIFSLRLYMNLSCMLLEYAFLNSTPEQKLLCSTFEVILFYKYLILYYYYKAMAVEELN